MGNKTNERNPNEETLEQEGATAAENPIDQEAKPEENETLQEENIRLNDQLLRQAAEFDNFRKRTGREKAELLLFSKMNCVKEILSVLDNFERALSAECKDEEYQKGVEMIFSQFKETLSRLGVQEIHALGESFDPEVHNAVNQVEDENFGQNTVCEVFQKGYRIEDKVIRHAVVVVANP